MLNELTSELKEVFYIIHIYIIIHLHFSHIAKVYTMNYNNNMNEVYLELVNVPFSVPSSLSIL